MIKGLGLLDRLDRLSDEQHRSERIAARWHRLHVAVILADVVLGLCEAAWHWRAAARHARDAGRRP